MEAPQDSGTPSAGAKDMGLSNLTYYPLARGSNEWQNAGRFGIVLRTWVDALSKPLEDTYAAIGSSPRAKAMTGYLGIPTSVWHPL
jgi:hypothetical protein